MTEPVAHPPLKVRRWVLAHALVFGFAGLVLAALSALRQPSSPFGDDLETRLIIVLGAVVIGRVQGRFLNGRVLGWGRASLLGAGLGAGLALLVELILPDQAPGDLRSMGLPWAILLPVLWVPSLGLGVGLGQGWALRRRTISAAAWGFASLLSWTLSLPAAFIAQSVLSIVMVVLVRSPSMFVLHRVIMTGLFWLAFGAFAGFITLALLAPRLRGPGRPPPAAGPAAGREVKPEPQPDAAPHSPLQLWHRWLPAHLGAYALENYRKNATRSTR
jgi:hypothetical protein